MSDLKVSERQQVYTWSGVSTYLSPVANLMVDLGLDSVVVAEISLVFRGNMVSTAGGAITGFTLDAPAGFMTSLELSGNYRPRGNKNRTVVSMPPHRLYYPGSLEKGAFQALLRTSAGASSTDPFRAAYTLPLIDKHSPIAPFTYLDTRDYSTLVLQSRLGALTDLAATNLSSVSGVELEVTATVIENPPPIGTPHFEPMIVHKEMTIATSSTKLETDKDMPSDGLMTALWLQQNDDSASGDSKRTDGILKKVSAVHAGRVVIDDTFVDGLKRKTYTRYPYVLSTTEIVGVYGVAMQPHLRMSAGNLLVRRDTSTTIPVGITSVTPATADTLYVTAIAAEPVHGAHY